MKNSSLILVFVVIVLHSACAPKINYLGNSYAPTQQVEIFFDEKDVHADYKVMGMIDNEGDEFEEDDPEAVQQAMVEKAKEVGADAILFTGFYNRVITENNTQISTTEYREGTDTYINSGTTTKKIIEGKLLKYK